MLLSGYIFLPCLMSIMTLSVGEATNAGGWNLPIHLKMKIQVSALEESTANEQEMWHINHNGLLTDGTQHCAKQVTSHAESALRWQADRPCLASVDGICAFNCSFL